MILQQWIMSCCDGKPSIAVRRIEAVHDAPIFSPSTIYRALRTPTTMPGKLAGAIVEASNGECTLPELVDIELIRASFEYSNPDLKQRGLEFALAQAERRLRTLETRLAHAQSFVDKQTAECVRIKTQLEQSNRVVAVAETRARRAGVGERIAAARPVKRKRKRQAKARAA